MVRNSYVESGRDVTYHPLFRQAELDQFCDLAEAL